MNLSKNINSYMGELLFQEGEKVAGKICNLKHDLL